MLQYINGQLYDTIIPRWKADNALAAAQKFAAEGIAVSETAGENGCVPHTLLTRVTTMMMMMTSIYLM